MSCSKGHDWTAWTRSPDGEVVRRHCLKCPKRQERKAWPTQKELDEAAWLYSLPVTD